MIGSHFEPVEMFWRAIRWFSLIGGWKSMLEVPHPGEQHRDVALARHRDDLLVADRAARLDHRDGARVQAGLQRVREREERVARDHRALHAVARLADGDMGGVEPAHL